MWKSLYPDEKAGEDWHTGEVRIAVVSDIHGNLTAFEAVVADLRDASPDLVLHGGDLADSGASPAQIVDRIRELGWQGVAGNTDEMVFEPDSLTRFAARLPLLKSIFDKIAEMADDTRERLGEDRIAWLRQLPMVQQVENFAFVHAVPGDLWRAPGEAADDEDLHVAYAPLGKGLVGYGHIHVPYVREVGGIIVANSGSVGQSHDGDRRASYLLLDNGRATVRRVEYDLARELKALAGSGLPHADWVARILETARPEMP